MITLHPITENDIRGCSALLAENFNSHKFFSEGYLNWLYFQNPLGKVLGYNAWSDRDLIAHYATIPITTLRNGKTEKSLLSVNSVTDSNYRKQGLFNELAKNTYDRATKDGYSSVIAVANKASTPSFLNTLGFDLICPLDISIGFGNLNINSRKLKRLSVFRRDWSSQEIVWRKNNPNKQVFICKRDMMSSISSGINKLFASYAETPFFDKLHDNTFADRLDLLKLRVFVGKIPNYSKNFNLYVKLPHSLKPAPFNMIYKSLGNLQKPPDEENVFFNFFDFDVL